MQQLVTRYRNNSSYPTMSANSRSTHASHLQTILRQFTTTSLYDIQAVALQDRIDIKYVLQPDTLMNILAQLTNEYTVLEINGLQLHPYHTLYFDTPDFAWYQQHHANWRPRYKVRSRRYLSTDTSFLEIKCKTNKSRTIKHRIETSDFLTTLDGNHVQILEYIWDQPPALEPKLQNTFSRITLVHHQYQERVTIDINLSYTTAQHHLTLPGLVVVEVKQQSINRHSPIMQLMRNVTIRPTSFSKYCVGLALLYPNLKHNLFMPQLRLVESLVQGASYA